MWLSLVAFGATLIAASAAQAQQPLNPYDAAAPVAPPAPAPPLDVAQPLNPYAPEAYPAPPAYGYQPPEVGIGRVPPAPPSYQQGYYLYPGPNQPPVYYAPPPVYSTRYTCAQLCAQRTVVHRWDGVRRFSLGVHASVLGLNQKVGTNDVVLGGAGFQLRLRSKGRFGFEARQSFLHAEYWKGGFERTSYPFALSLMVYVFPNQDTRHFNIYGLLGVGAMADSVRIRFAPGDYRSQDFLEWEGHVGLGLELRFRWFAIEVEGRGIGLVRDNSDRPAVYYNGIQGGPIPEKSLGLQGNAYLSFWF
jgi:hypothetical protein